MKIAVAGMGYVGLSLAVLLSQHNTVYAIDPIAEKVDRINRRESPIRDSYLEEYLRSRKLDLHATTDEEKAYQNAQFVIVAVPTNYDADRNFFDTSAVEAVAETVHRICPEAIIVIKSTVPIGYTKSLRERMQLRRVLFSPEFLREGHALYDNLYPSRIIVGTDPQDRFLTEQAQTFAGLLEQGAEKSGIDVSVMGFSEAEAVKLFANTYLAMRISYFNELDTFAECSGLDARQIICGVCQDPRIGMYYNNPSFGYGGYCLPKDTKQLLANYAGIPEAVIQATVASNDLRGAFIAEQIRLRLDRLRASGCCTGKTVGIYRLAMKTDSDNFRCSAIFGVIERLRSMGIDLAVYEPALKDDAGLPGCRRITDWEQFKRESVLIVANRFDEQLLDVKEKVYTRDLFRRD